VDALGERFGDLKRPAADDICYATQNRQDAVKQLARSGATLILVIGSDTSSNASRLVEVAEREGATALLIDGESGLDPELLEGHETVGVTAGASTPEELVALVLRGLASFGYDELGELEVARENVSFRLPREVTSTAL
jgi:4-hydroxy-3-methylbut-2-enyl diphosphate reductase